MVIGPTEHDSFADNTGSTLRAMGHTVLETGSIVPGVGLRRIDNMLSILSDRSERLREIEQRRLLSAASDFRPDLTITHQRALSRRTIRVLQDLGGRVDLWYPDAVSNFGNHDMFLAGYDSIYLKNPQIVDRLRRIQGLNVYYMPEACNPMWHRPLCEYGTEAVIVMAGSMHPTRSILVNRLLDSGVPLRIYGNLSGRQTESVKRAHANRYIAREEKSRVFRSARAVLNNLHPAEFAGVNCRVFEATAAGAVVLTEDREGLKEMFEAGNELLTFDSFDGLLELCERLIRDPAEGRSIADRASARSLRDHSYMLRLSAILERARS